jgi:hypothetical protein
MEDLQNYLLQSNEALRIKNLQLQDEVDRLTMNIEVIDAEIISNEYKNNYNYSFKQK